jgi:hypothetical protein
MTALVVAFAVGAAVGFGCQGHLVQPGPRCGGTAGGSSDEQTSRNHWTRSLFPTGAKGDGSDLGLVPIQLGLERSAS